jgi:hypothetical protein
MNRVKAAMLQERRWEGRFCQVRFEPPRQGGQLALRVIVAHRLARRFPHVFLRVQVRAATGNCTISSPGLAASTSRLASPDATVPGNDSDGFVLMIRPCLLRDDDVGNDWNQGALLS